MGLRNVCKIGFIAVLFLSAFTPQCAADFIMNGINQSGSSSNSGFGYFPGANDGTGYRFTVGATPLAVTRLGMFDAMFGTIDPQGLRESHQIGLWNSSGTLLASVTVGAGTSVPLTGAFRYVSLATQVLLNPGQTYTIAAHYTTPGTTSGVSPGDFLRVIWGTAIPNALSPLISFNGGVYYSNPGASPNLQFPTEVDPFTAYVSANAEFIAVPVPAGISLASLGIACLVVIRFRRAKQVSVV